MTNPDRIERNSHEMRDTIVKSGLSGVAATVLAVTIWSPAGLGGMIGTSVASGLGSESGSTPSSDALAQLAAYPVPITPVELADINARLAASTQSLDAMRAATDDEIALIKSLAGASSEDAAPQLAAEMAFPQVQAAPVALAQTAPVQGLRRALEPADVIASEVNYSPSYAPPMSDPHMELAELLLAHR